MDVGFQHSTEHSCINCVPLPALSLLCGSRFLHGRTSPRTQKKLFSKQENNDYGKEGTNSDEIPLDDVSPRTCAEMVWKCVKKLPSF